MFYSLDNAPNNELSNFHTVDVINAKFEAFSRNESKKMLGFEL